MKYIVSSKDEKVVEDFLLENQCTILNKAYNLDIIYFGVDYIGQIPLVSNDPSIEIIEIKEPLE